MDYQIDLDIFRGPMDLLLYLVKRDEVDVFDIPISRIADQYLHYLELLKLIDVERVGEFLVMASTLMEIKSRMLLPASPADAEEDVDPRMELVKQLVEYKKFKDAAALLEERAEAHAARFPRLASFRPSEELDAARQPIRHVELWDLVSAFGRLMRETLATQPREIVYDDTPLHLHMGRIVDKLAARKRMSFAEAFDPPHSRSRLVGLFLALLELIRGGRVRIEQDDPFAEIQLNLVENGDSVPASSGTNS